MFHIDRQTSNHVIMSLIILANVNFLVERLTMNAIDTHCCAMRTVNSHHHHHPRRRLLPLITRATPTNKHTRIRTKEQRVA